MHAVEVPFEGKLRQAEANDEASDNMTLLAALTINMAEIDRVAIDRRPARVCR